MKAGTVLGVAAVLGAPVATAFAQSSFVNWESPHVSPLAMTPDGSRVLAVNTADNRLAVFRVLGSKLSRVGSIPVGLDPVSVRARTSTEAWVVNHVSDSISIVDLDAMSVVMTISTGDEPADVVFAGQPERAFVSLSQVNAVAVYDPDDPAASPVLVPIQGEDPRALATDGTNVYIAIFESGNDTTILAQPEVSNALLNPYAGAPNPPPNAGGDFDPPIAGDLPTPPEVGLIVRKDAAGDWRDDNGGDWSGAVTWDLHGHDVAVIDAASLAVSYIGGLLNANMHLAVTPAGNLLVVGTEAFNEIRFEPNLNGVFARVRGGLVAPGAAAPFSIIDLNPHLDYATPTAEQAVRDLSIGDPRGVAFDGDGRAFITGMGSNNVVVTDAGLARQGLVEVSAGPTGIVANDAEGVVYVLSKFDASISVIGLESLDEIQRVPYFDPTPAVIRAGRPHLYDTHATSGLGHLSCASCHIDGRMDQLAWDLGDPSGAVKPFNQNCNFGGIGCEDWHPMKGPMATQTLIGSIGTGPLHWRGDRENLAAFNGAFVSLLGDDQALTTAQMQQFTSFVATLRPSPNPSRNIDGTLRSSVPTSTGLPGNADLGRTLFNTGNLADIQCSDCHAGADGTNGIIVSPNVNLGTQSMKIPQLRNMHEKTGFSRSSASNNRGFGYTHDGSVDTIFSFLDSPRFNFTADAIGDQQRRDVEAFMLSFAIDTHAGVGQQVTMRGEASDDLARRDLLVAIADAGQVRLVVKGVVAGEARGYAYLGGNVFQSDRAAEIVTLAQLDAAVGPGAEQTYTLVPQGSRERIGIDRDEDGYFDRDELDACGADPADPNSTPDDPGCTADIAFGGDGEVDITDLLDMLAQWGAPDGPADTDCSGVVGLDDLMALLSQWGPC